MWQWTIEEIQWGIEGSVLICYGRGWHAVSVPARVDLRVRTNTVQRVSVYAEERFVIVMKRNFSVIVVIVAMVLCFGMTVGAAEDGGDTEAAPETESATDYSKLENPVPFTKKSISRGKRFFIQLCSECHGRDGKALLDFIADAMDLTVPQYWKHGSTPGETYRTIRDGAGVGMPPYKMLIRREEDMWHVVNFVQSLWPSSMRPQLQEEMEKDRSENEGKKPSQNGGKDHEEESRNN